MLRRNFSIDSVSFIEEWTIPSGENPCAFGKVSGGRSRSTIAIGYVFNQPNLKESTSELLITGPREDSPLEEVVSHLRRLGCG
jgi:hypothetical protein